MPNFFPQNLANGKVVSLLVLESDARGQSYKAHLHKLYQKWIQQAEFTTNYINFDEINRQSSVKIFNISSNLPPFLQKFPT